LELQIDTSTRYASVGLSREGRSLVEIAWRSERNHSVELAPNINRALDHAGAKIGDLTAVFAASGPGGFSALRVGMSTAKAIAFTSSIPLVTVGTLELELHPFRGLSRSVCAIMSAGRTRLYVGSLNPGDDDEAQIGLQDLDSFLEQLSPDTLYCGEAAPDLESEIRERIGSGAIISQARPPSRRSSSLAHLGYAKLQSGRTADAATVSPVYLRSSQVSSANRRWARGQRPN
jgi:tRNA threonylcarbamoyladenosine biosynthesis protein TsaB